MTDERCWGLLDRFLAGECSPPERAAVLEWLEVHPFAAEYIEAVRRALAQHEGKPSPRRWPGATSPGFRIAAVLALGEPESTRLHSPPRPNPYAVFSFHNK